MGESEILILHQGDARYEDVFAALRTDADLLRDLWTATESRLEEHPGKVWVLAVRDGRALAWCAYEPTSERGAVIKAVDSYERPESWADDLYAEVYAARHELIRDYAAVTYVFDAPLDLHLGDGWVPVGDGWSDEPDAPAHHWTCLVRAADATAGA